jgi:hypothetical protein
MRKGIYFFLTLFTGFLFLQISLFAQKTVYGIKSGEVSPNDILFSSPGCDTIFSFPTPDVTPVGLAFDGIHLFSMSSFNDVIYKFDTLGQLVGRVPNPDSLNFGGDLDFDGANIWVVIEQSGRVYKIDTTTGHVTTSFPIPSSGTPVDPNNYGCAWDHGYLWISEYIDQTLLRMNATTGEIVDSFAIHRMVLPLKVIHDNLYGIEFVDESAYGRMQLDKFDKSTGALIDSVPWCLPYSLGLTWAKSHLWGLSSGFGIGNSRIYKMDSLLGGISNLLPSTVRISVFPNPAGDKVTINGPGKINRVDIYNLLGEKVSMIADFREGAPKETDISYLQQGIYFLRIFLEGKIYTTKFVKL